jgi:F-type H+-transporting ATPase subunit beta
MTLVTRSAVRLTRRGGQAMKAARANAAFFNTAATQASNLLPKARAEAGKMRMASAPGKCWLYTDRF